MEIKVTLPDANISEEGDSLGTIKTKWRRTDLVPKQSQQRKPRPVSAPARCYQPVKVPLVSNYDIDNEYDYIMEKALAAYRRHCQKDVPGESLKLDDISQHSEHTPQVTPRPFHLSLARVSEINPQQRKDPRQRPWTALPNKFDAVRMVAAANMAEPSSKPRQILHVKTLQMGESEVANSGIFHRNHPRDIRKYQSTTALTSKPSATLNAKTNGNVLSSSLSEKLFYSTSHQKRNNKREAWTQSGRTPSTSRYTRPNLHSAYLVVHPDWLSQSMHIQKLSLTTRPFMNNTCFEDSSFVPRRCKSAPPTKH